MKQFIEAGEFVTTHGITGELKLYPWCDGPDFIAKIPSFYLSKDGGKKIKIEKVRNHKNMCIIKLEGVNSIDDARVYIKKVAYFLRTDVKLPKGRYFVQDIIGCTVKDANTNEIYGEITNVTHPGANDVYEIKNEKGEVFLFPAVNEFLSEILPEEGVVTICPISGMFTNTGGNDDEN